MNSKNIDELKYEILEKNSNIIYEQDDEEKLKIVTNIISQYYNYFQNDMDNNYLENFNIEINNCLMKNNNNEFKFIETTEEENLEEYKKFGGYCLSYVGEIFKQRYVLIMKLGWNKDYTIWLVKDFKDESYKKLKIYRIDIVNFFSKFIMIKDTKNLENVYDLFIHNNFHGKFICIITDLTMINLKDLLLKKKNFEINTIKNIILQLVNGLNELKNNFNINSNDLDLEKIEVVIKNKEDIDNLLNERKIEFNNRIEKLKIDIKNDEYNINNNLDFSVINKLIEKETIINNFENSDNQKNKILTQNDLQNEYKKILNENKNLNKKEKKKIKKRLKKKLKKNLNSKNNNQDYQKINLKEKIIFIKYNIFDYIIPEDLSELKIIITDISTNSIIKNHLKSPECFLGNSKNCDVWSLGCIFFEMLTGNILYNLNSQNYNEKELITYYFNMLKTYPINNKNLIFNEYKFDFKNTKEDENLHINEFPKIIKFISSVYNFKIRDSIIICSFLLNLLEINLFHRIKLADIPNHLFFTKYNNNDIIYDKTNKKEEEVKNNGYKNLIKTLNEDDLIYLKYIFKYLDTEINDFPDDSTFSSESNSEYEEEIKYYDYIKEFDKSFRNSEINENINLKKIDRTKDYIKTIKKTT